MFTVDYDTKVDTIKTDSDGKAKTKFLEAGEYYLKETSNLTGYAVNSKILILRLKIIKKLVKLFLTIR
ncbi:MAG: prealbumin-like fold domain-containing protein [Thomasclavelia ramosa]